MKKTDFYCLNCGTKLKRQVFSNCFNCKSSFVINKQIEFYEVKYFEYIISHDYSINKLQIFKGDELLYTQQLDDLILTFDNCHDFIDRIEKLGAYQ